MSNFTKLKLCHTLGISQSTHIWVKGALTALLLVLCGNVAKAADVPTSWKDVAFNGDIRYSQWVINSRISDFYANTTQRGFNTYDKNGTQTGSSKGSQKFDYVPGLVAKAVLEAYANYSTFDWSKPWFYSVMNYAKDNKYTLVAKSGVTDFSKITLDNMNACKMYFPLMESDALSTGAKSTGETAIANVLTDMKKYNEVYVIGNGSKSGVGGSSNETVKSMFGGWFHKPSYTDQMWCDGLYMGSALLAQIVNYKNSTKNVDQTSDWDLITKQFTISWNQLYDTNKGLLYHAFTANPGDNASSAWSGISKTSGSEVYHSAAFWGRAMGWYFLALVDVLEQMPSNNSNRATLIDYLQKLAAGLAKYQHTSGCWYQVVDEKDDALSGNYLESSCTSLFAAAYLKAVRLGLLSTDGTYNYKTIGENAFKGAVTQFMKYDTFEPTGTTVQLVHNCASAGLGGDKKRTGSREYYITGSDVGQTNTYTEGKVMGAFIMAATEYELANPKDIRFSYDLAPTYTLTKGGSITAKALGSGTIKYQWFKSGDPDVSVATTETFTPTESGKYYCKATSDNGSGSTTTIQTSTTTVTVNEVPTPSESTNAVVWTFTNSTLTSGTLGTENNVVEFTSTDGSKTVMTYVSGGDDAIRSSSETINGVEYSSYLKENGKGSVSGNRRMEFNAPSSKGTVTIVYAGTVAPMTIVDGGNNNAPLAELEATANTAVTSDVLTTTVGNKIIIYCPANKSYIYSVIWTPINEPTGPSISISSLPESANYLTGATVTPLSVAVTFNNATADDYTVTYQWKKNKENSTTGGDEVGTNASTYTPEVTTTGTAYYYCVVTATLKSDDSKTLTATSNVATITVKDKTYTVTYNMMGYGTQIDPASDLTALPDPLPTPTATGYTFGGWYTDEALTQEATAGVQLTSDVTLYAKWTINKYNVTTTAQYGSIAIEDGDGSPIQPNTEVPYGTKLVFTATPNSAGYEFSSWTVTGTIGTENSNVYTIESLDAETSVRANFTETSSATYSYKVTSGDTTAPGINTSKYITTRSDGETGDKLVKMTFGGWKWEGFASKDAEDAGTKTKGSYKIVRGKEPKYYTDSWSAAKTEGVDKPYGYDYWFVGAQDAVDESKASNGIIYGTERFGWFKTQTTDAANNVTTYPFTLPVRGAYMTFEPTENGWLTIYILQNGVWNTFNSDTKVDNVQYKKYDIKPGEFRMHSFFITNQRGLTVQDFAPDMYSYDVNQKVESGYSCSLYKSTDKPADSNMNIHGKDVSYWPEFWTLDDTEREAVYTHWANGDNGSETVIELSNGSFLLIQKAVIKYRFHVTGSETYYFFSNFSKMGFAGAEFQPDNAQPTEPLTLKDTEKYSAPTAGINGKVDNVTIPQYESITLDRTFKAGQWTTLTLPFNLTQDEVQKIFGAGTQIIMLDKATLENGGAHLHFIYHEIQNVLPGYPYLIKPTQEVNSFTANNKCINPSIKQFEVDTDPYTFKGTPGYCTADKTNNGKSGYSVQYYENDIFVSENDGKLYVSGGASYGKGYRAWLQKNKAITTPVKSISVVMSSFSDDDDTTTSIDVAEMAPDLIEALGIQTGVYNLSGQRVANDTRNLKAGIYIVNGKKTVVR